MANPLEEPDKSYWHRYLDFYEGELSGFQCKHVLEFGVWKGASIQWLMDYFPEANIYGADILNIQPSWPVDERVKYFKVDQGNAGQVRALFKQIGMKLDLIIEDGSHMPMHQRNCLVESIPHIRSGGIYILEDIQTSHPNHPYYRKVQPLFKSMVGPLHLLLAIDHLKLGSYVQSKLAELTMSSLFDIDDVRMLNEKIDTVKIYKRTALPKRCFACGSSDFNYAALKCKCGISLYAETDSMSALIRVK